MEIFYPNQFLNFKTRDCCEEHTDSTSKKQDLIKKPDDLVAEKPKYTYEYNQKKPMELPPKQKPPKQDSCKNKINPNDYPKYAVSGEALGCCLDKLTYIWQNDDKEYWCYIFYIDKVCFVGWRWQKHVNDWVYFGVDISKVEAFSCKR